jgi:hypothetical protein
MLGEKLESDNDNDDGRDLAEVHEKLRRSATKIHGLEEKVELLGYYSITLLHSFCA